MVKQQESQTREQYAQMKNALELIRKKVSALTVTSPVDGQLTSVWIVKWDKIRQKGNIWDRLDILSGFKVRVGIEEHYISRILHRP